MTEMIATDHKPDWITVLDNQCKARTQSAVADELGYSPTVISQVLKGNYSGDNTKVEAKVRGMYMGAMVQCHIVGGAIPRNRCIEQQGRPFAATNPLRVQLYHACPTCKNNTKPKPERKEMIA